MQNHFQGSFSKETSKQSKLMHRLLALIVVMTLLVSFVPVQSAAATVAASASNATAASGLMANTISAELIGQVFNASPKVSVQYGYVSYLSGVEPSVITAPGGTLSEQSALLTFYSDTATERVLNNGPMRTINRSGVVTFYLNMTPTGNFSDTVSFRQGVAVMKATLRHQVVLNTLTNAFTAHFDCTITSSESFKINGKTYRLSKPGQPFEITFSGHVNQNGPPSGFMAGFVTGLELKSTGK